MENPHEHPLICLAGVKFDQIQQIVQFMYLGEVKIAEAEVTSFIELGRELEIYGIIGQFENDPALAEQSVEPIESGDPLHDNVLVPINDDVSTDSLQNVIEIIKEEAFEDFDLPKVLKKEKIFKCNKCDFTSVHYASVRKHKISKHDGIKYQCEKCEKSFTDSSTLLRHRKSIHDGIVYKCELCQKTFSDGSALTRHKKTQHSTEIPPIYDPLFDF